MKKLLFLPLIVGLLSFISMDTLAQYCTPSTSTSWGSTTKTTTSGGSININKTSSSQGNHNYTATDSVSTGLGQSFTVACTHNYSVSIWVDWNDDGDFTDAGEEIWKSPSYENFGPRTTTKTVTVPSTASTGQLRMRILSGYYWQMASCGYSTYTSDVEDYRLFVEPPLARDAEVTALDPEIMCSGSQNIDIKISNRGTDSIASITLAGSIGSTSFGPTTFTGLDVKNNKDTVLNLGTFTFVDTSTYSMQFYSYNINGTTDLKTSNDTLDITGYKSAMSGNFTIGGTSPDYTTIASAIADMTSKGLCGPVVFNIRQGTYNSRNSIGAVNGASATNTITFQADTNNTAAAILTYNSDYTWLFNGASHVTLKNLEIRTTGNANVIEFRGMNSHHTIEGCKLTGSTFNSTSNAYAVIYDWTGAANLCENISIRDNEILNGSYSIYMYGVNTSTHQDSLWIEDNDLTGFYYRGAYIYYVNAVVVEDNYMESKSAAYCCGTGGIYSYYSNNIQYNRNEIVLYASSYSYGLYLYRNYGTTSQRNMVSNNMVSKPNVSTSSGNIDYFYYCNYTDIVHNSWRAKMNYNSTSYGIVRLYFGTSVKFHNNVIHNDSPNGYCIRVYGTHDEKYNNYYNDASTKRRYPVSGGTNQTNLDPGFTSTTDLHSVSINLYKAGQFFAGVTDDIDGDARDTTNPCLGADEFFIPNRDAAPTEIVYAPSCPGTETIKVRVENKGLDTLTSFKVDWSVATNGGSAVGKSQISWSVTGGIINGLYPGDDTVLTLGNLTLANGSTYDIRAISSSPNNSTDQKTENDTLNREIETAMSGTYTVGGLSPDFTTAKDALDAMTERGLCGAVVFDIRPGNYVGTLSIGSIAGSSPTNTVTWKGASTANTTLSSTTPLQDYSVVKLDGAEHMIFKHLKVSHSASGSYYKSFWITGTTKNIVIDSCELSQSNKSSFGGGGVILSSTATSTTSTGNTAGNITVSNCDISGSYYGILISGGASATNRVKNITIENNVLSDIGNTGLYIYYYMDSVEINGNDLSDYGGTSYGVYMYYVRNFTLEDNTIYSGGSYALYLNRCNWNSAPSSSIGRVANNMISQTASTYGVYSYYTNYLDFYHNSVRSSSSYGFYDYFGNAKDIRNNIFYSGTNYAYYARSGTSTYISTMDNNLYYRGNGTGIAYDAGARDLTSWKNYRTSLNQNSAQGDPKFAAADDLHIANGKFADSLAATGLGVTADIDGDTRSTTNPDAGADEYDYQPIDGDIVALTRPSGMCLSATDTLEFAVVNVGGDTIQLGTNGVNIAWSVTGPNTASGTDAANNGSLAPGDTVFIKTANATINLSDAGKYTVTAYITSTWDKYNENDTLVAELNRIATESIIANLDTTIYYKDSMNVNAISDLGQVDVVISEACQFNSSTGAPSGGRPGYMNQDDYVEISTARPNTDLEGYTFERWRNSAANINYTFPAGVGTGPNGTLILGEGSGTSSSPANYYWVTGGTSNGTSSSTQAGYILKDPSGAIIDVTATNGYTFPVSAGVTSSDWTGGTTGSSGGTHGIRRTGGPDNNGPTNWSVSSSANRQTPNIFNPNMGLVASAPDHFKWVYNGSTIDTLLSTQAGPWIAKGTKDYIASFVSPCTGDTIRDTATIVAFATNLVLSSEAPEYYSYPLSQSNGIDFSGDVDNYGDSLSSVRVYGQLAGSAVGDTLASSVMARFDNVGWDIENNGISTTTGMKTITYYLTASAADDFPEDDTSMQTVNMTDTVMARENGSLEYNVFNANHASYGQRFEVFTQDSVTGAQVYIKTAFPGDKFKVALYNLNGNTVGTMINESNDLTLTTVNDTGLKSLRFKCLSVLAAGEYLVAVTKTSTVFSSGIGGTATNAVSSAAFSNNGTSWSTMNWNSNAVHLGIRLEFGSYDFPTFAALAPVCETGDTMTVMGGSPGGGTYFGTGITNGVLDPTALSVGSNSVGYTVDNALGCPDTIYSNIEVKGEPTVSSTFTQLTSCITNNASISVSASNGFGTFSYSINGGTSFGSSSSFTNLGSGSYTVVVEDSVCTVVDSTYIASPPNAPATPTATGGSTYCKGASLTSLSVSSNTSGTPGTFRWYTDGSLTQLKGTGTSISAFDSIATITYYVVEDRAGCVSPTDTTTVTVNALPNVNNSALSNRCTNADTLSLSTGTPTGGTYFGPGISNGVFNPNVAGAGTHSLSYTYVDANNCTDTASASVTIYQAPVVTFSSLDSACTNTPLTTLLGGLPTGGTYSGFGVSAGSFNASTAGIGLHAIKYKVTNTNCADSATSNIRVHLAPTVTASSIADRCLDAAPLTLTAGSPSGGMYSGNGTSGGVFDPSVAGAGTHTLSYVYTDGNMCMDSTTVTAHVDSLPIASLSTLSSVCTNTQLFAFNQGSATPTGGTGTYFGNGVSSGSFFIASTAGAGSHTIGYAYVDGNGCRDTAMQTQVVDTVTTATWAQLGDVCVDAQTFSLSGGMPANGVYKGAGVLAGGNFLADSAGVGTHTLTYVFTNGFGCMDSTTEPQKVNPLPIVGLGLQNNWCLNATPIQLNMGTPMGGTYTINGVTDTVYSNTVSQLDTVIYSYTDGNTCTNTDTVLIMADTVPIVTFSAIPGNCVGYGTYRLVEGLPAGGVYSGNSVSNGRYDPAVVKTDTLSYVFTDANGCIDSASQSITVNPLPVVTLSSMIDICENTPVYALAGGAPSGGSYNGAGVSAGNYDAGSFGVGLDMITYVYTDANNCTDSSTTGLRVNQVTPAIFTWLGHTCENNDLRALAANGKPSGGVFTGTGVTGNDFDPTVAGVGTHTLNYTFTNADNCMDSTTSDIIVEAAPQFNATVLLSSGCGENPPIVATDATGMTHRWSNGETADTVEYTFTTTPWVKVTDPNTIALCSNYDTATAVTYEAVCLGVDGALAGTGVRYYPNPNKGTFYYELEGFEGMDVDVSIHSMSGQVVYQENWSTVSDFHTGEIQVEVFESGVYYITLNTNKGNVMHKITINR